MKNRLLVCTQEMNIKSTTLGFMHSWVIKLAQKYDQVIVVCLFAAEYDLPENAKVISLGKEGYGKEFLNKNSLVKKIITRIKYVFNFYKAIIKERKNYDKVFIHMNEEYGFLGGPFWKLSDKKVVMWSNHYMGNWMKDLAGKYCTQVFYTSRFSYTANKNKFPQGIQMPVGVDVESLNTSEVFEVPENSVLFLARLDPSKKPEIILHALKKLQDENISFVMDFVGGVSKDKWPNYEAEVKKLKEDLGLGDNVRFVGAVPSTETYKYYLSHAIYVNVAKSGMLDKTIFKALAAGCLPLTTSVDFNEMIESVAGDTCRVEQDNVDSLVERLKYSLALEEADRKLKVKAMQDVVIEKHSLDTLVSKIYELV